MFLSNHFLSKYNYSSNKNKLQQYIHESTEKSMQRLIHNNKLQEYTIVSLNHNNSNNRLLYTNYVLVGLLSVSSFFNYILIKFLITN
jgi:hypothetical protein